MQGRANIRQGGTTRWRPSRARLRWRLYLLLVAVDVVVLLASHAAAGALRFGDAFDMQALRLFRSGRTSAPPSRGSPPTSLLRQASGQQQWREVAQLRSSGPRSSRSRVRYLLGRAGAIGLKTKRVWPLC